MKQTVNERIKILRSEMNLTQKTFSQFAGITDTTLWRIENSEGDVSAKTINQISEAFQVPMEWLRHGKGEMKFVIPSEKQILSSDPWRDEAYRAMKNQVDFLQGLVTQLMQGGKLGKYKVSEIAAVLLNKGTVSGTGLTDLRPAA